MSDFLAAAGIGAGATVVVDLWSLLLKHAFKVPSLSFCLVGRWFLHMQAGRFAHAKIAAAQPRKHECAIGWLAHYAIGIAFGVGFVCLAPAGWLQRPSIVPALVFGLVTVLFPYLVMQPAFGLGVAASKAPDPAIARLKSLSSHLVFGLGLYICGLVFRQLVAA